MKPQTSSEKDDVDLNGEYTEKCVIVINKDFFISLLYNFFIQLFDRPLDPLTLTMSMFPEGWTDIVPHKYHIT